MNDIVKTFRQNRTLILTLTVLTILFLLAVQGMSTKDWIVTLLRSLSEGAVIFLVAAGFSIILGLMDVLNLAHGVLYMIGAYVGWSVYVRPDSFIDLVTPLALLVAGFTLMPLWGKLLDRFRVPENLVRIWPWIGLGVAGVVLVSSITKIPVAIWNPDEYTESPITWTQAFDTGKLADRIQALEVGEASPVVGLGGTLLGSIIAAISISGFSHRQSAAGETAHRITRGTYAVFLVTIIIGFGVFIANDALTNFLLALDTTWLFLIAVGIATLSGAALGALMEASLIRPLYERPLYQIMLTFGLGFIGTEIVRAIWGRSGFTMPKPSLFGGTGEGCPATSVGEWFATRCSILALEIQGETARIRVYNEIFLIIVGLIVLVGVWLLLQRTRLGMIIRAGVQDAEMVQALGINVRQVFTLVFALGVGLAALGGVLAAPSFGLSDAMGVTLLISALIALAIGGLTSYPGAAAGAILVGLLRQFITKYGQLGIPLPFLEEPFKPTPPLVPASAVLLMVIILLVMPQGLFGRKE
jgi:branched-chain amino acid transport system permease protein